MSDCVCIYIYICVCVCGGGGGGSVLGVCACSSAFHVLKSFKGNYHLSHNVHAGSINKNPYSSNDRRKAKALSGYFVGLHGSQPVLLSAKHHLTKITKEVKRESSLLSDASLIFLSDSLES